MFDWNCAHLKQAMFRAGMVNLLYSSYFACVPLITQDPTTWAPPYSYLPTLIQPLPPTPFLNQ